MRGKYGRGWMLDGVERKEDRSRSGWTVMNGHDGLSEDEKQNWVVWKNIDST